MFVLSPTPLKREELFPYFTDPQVGGFVSFEGWVRNHNQGREVTRLKYQAYQKLAQKEAEQILQEAKSKFSICQAMCAHRVGVLEIGEMAVWVGVSAHHRKDAFLACSYIIDQLKGRVPIWKKEFYHDGQSGWISCPSCENSFKQSQPTLLE